jgi:A/G-specific adenine glycosylase
MENGKWKMEMDELMTIPGIGHYTAGAIRNFAFNLPTPCIDTNIRRILHRVFVGPENADGTWEKDDEFLLGIASEVLEEAIKTGTTADWHAALMDFGSLVQTKRNPRWDICPLTRERIMKTTKKNFPVTLRRAQGDSQKEPGRLVGSVFVPNRIFRGRIVEALRDAHRGLSTEEIGQRISVDWDATVHRAWLDAVMTKLLSDRMIREQRGKFVLG